MCARVWVWYLCSLVLFFCTHPLSIASHTVKKADADFHLLQSRDLLKIFKVKPTTFINYMTLVEVSNALVCSLSSNGTCHLSGNVKPWPNGLASRRKSTQVCKTRTRVRTCEGSVAKPDSQVGLQVGKTVNFTHIIG